MLGLVIITLPILASVLIGASSVVICTITFILEGSSFFLVAFSLGMMEVFSILALWNID